MITIENERFTVSIAPMGAELRSFTDQSTGREIMWSGDPAVWGGSAPILFPVVGASRDGRTTINGQVYEMPKHGLVRTRTADVIEHESDHVVLAFHSDTDTLDHYPFHFTLEVEFKLTDDQLSVGYRVNNRGEETMPFTLGSHPALALDLDRHATEDYFIEFDQPETLDLHGLENGLFAMKQKGYLENETKIPLTARLFDDDALIFTNIRSRSVRLKTARATGYLEIDLGGSPHLGLWAKPGAAYICVEPWLSHDDAADSDGLFENKSGIHHLAPGASFDTGYAIRIIE